MHQGLIRRSPTPVCLPAASSGVEPTTQSWSLLYSVEVPRPDASVRYIAVLLLVPAPASGITCGCYNTNAMTLLGRVCSDVVYARLHSASECLIQIQLKLKLPRCSGVQPA